MNDSVVQILGDIVAKVNTVLMPKLSLVTIGEPPVNRGIENVNYLYGPPKEIIKTLTAWTASDTYGPKKYPLVAVFQPFNEGKGQQVGVNGVDNLRIIIAMGTVADALTPARYTNNFYPILYPIYEELLRQINFDTRIITQSESLIQHTKVDWPYWDDGNDKNPFNDRLDVIELKNMKLNFKQKTC